MPCPFFVTMCSPHAPREEMNVAFTLRVKKCESSKRRELRLGLNIGFEPIPEVAFITRSVMATFYPSITLATAEQSSSMRSSLMPATLIRPLPTM
jgi:hypothetical protein